MSFEYPDALSQPIPDKETSESLASNTKIKEQGYDQLGNLDSLQIKIVAAARIAHKQEIASSKLEKEQAVESLRSLDLGMPPISASIISRQDIAKIIPEIASTIDPEKQKNMIIFNELIWRMEWKNDKPYPSIWEVWRTLSAVAEMIKDPENLRKFNDSLSKALRKDIKIAPGSSRYDEGLAFLWLDIMEGWKRVPHTFSLWSKSELKSKAFFPWWKDTYSDPSLSFDLVRLPDSEPPKV